MSAELNSHRRIEVDNDEEEKSLAFSEELHKGEWQRTPLILNQINNQCYFTNYPWNNYGALNVRRDELLFVQLPAIILETAVFTGIALYAFNEFDQGTVAGAVSSTGIALSFSRNILNRTSYYVDKFFGARED